MKSPAREMRKGGKADRRDERIGLGHERSRPTQRGEDEEREKREEGDCRPGRGVGLGLWVSDFPSLLFFLA